MFLDITVNGEMAVYNYSAIKYFIMLEKCETLEWENTAHSTYGLA